MRRRLFLEKLEQRAMLDGEPICEPGQEDDPESPEIECVPAPPPIPECSFTLWDDPHTDELECVDPPPPPPPPEPLVCDEGWSDDPNTQAEDCDVPPPPPPDPPSEPTPDPDLTEEIYEAQFWANDVLDELTGADGGWNYVAMSGNLQSFYDGIRALQFNWLIANEGNTSAQYLNDLAMVNLLFEGVNVSKADFQGAVSNAQSALDSANSLLLNAYVQNNLGYYETAEQTVAQADMNLNTVLDELTGAADTFSDAFNALYTIRSVVQP